MTKKRLGALLIGVPVLMAPDWPGCADCGDLRVSDIEVFGSGDAVKARFEIENAGEQSTDGFYVDAWVNPEVWPSAGSYGDAYTWFAGLSPGERRSFVLPLPRVLEPAPIPAEPAPIPADLIWLGELVVRVDSDGWVNEANEWNNYAAVQVGHATKSVGDWKFRLTTDFVETSDSDDAEGPATCFVDTGVPFVLAELPASSLPTGGFAACK